MPGSPTFRIVVTMCCCAIAFSLYTTPSDAGDTTARPVSLLQLLAAPTQYDGHWVTVRGYLARDGSPGTLYFARSFAGDPGDGIELLDRRAASDISANATLAHCLRNADVEVTGTFSHLHAGAYAVLSLTRVSAIAGAASCRWTTAAL